MLNTVTSARIIRIELFYLLSFAAFCLAPLISSWLNYIGLGVFCVAAVLKYFFLDADIPQNDASKKINKMITGSFICLSLIITALLYFNAPYAFLGMPLLMILTLIGAITDFNYLYRSGKSWSLLVLTTIFSVGASIALLLMLCNVVAINYFAISFIGMLLLTNIVINRKDIFNITTTPIATAFSNDSIKLGELIDLVQNYDEKQGLYRKLFGGDPEAIQQIRKLIEKIDPLALPQDNTRRYYFGRGSVIDYSYEPAIPARLLSPQQLYSLCQILLNRERLNPKDHLSERLLLWLEARIKNAIGDSYLRLSEQKMFYDVYFVSCCNLHASNILKELKNAGLFNVKFFQQLAGLNMLNSHGFAIVLDELNQAKLLDATTLEHILQIRYSNHDKEIKLRNRSDLDIPPSIDDLNRLASLVIKLKDVGLLNRDNFNSVCHLNLGDYLDGNAFIEVFDILGKTQPPLLDQKTFTKLCQEQKEICWILESFRKLAKSKILNPKIINLILENMNQYIRSITAVFCMLQNNNLLTDQNITKAIQTLHHLDGWNANLYSDTLQVLNEAKPSLLTEANFKLCDAKVFFHIATSLGDLKRANPSLLTHDNIAEVLGFAENPKDIAALSEQLRILSEQQRNQSAHVTLNQTTFNDVVCKYKEFIFTQGLWQSDHDKKTPTPLSHLNDPSLFDAKELGREIFEFAVNKPSSRTIHVAREEETNEATEQPRSLNTRS